MTRAANAIMNLADDNSRIQSRVRFVYYAYEEM